MRSHKKPQAGIPFSGQVHSYTYWLVTLAWIGLSWYIRHDTAPKGAHFIPRAYGIEPSWKLWLFLIAHGLIGLSCVSVVATTYYKFTGYYFTQDRIGFARAGGSDISNWVCIIVNSAFVAAFAFLIPPGVLGVLRPYVLILTSSFTTFAIARVVATVTFRAIFGDPSARSRGL
jgi:hypothetical protein